jgi:hypothetical protein
MELPTPRPRRSHRLSAVVETLPTGVALIVLTIGESEATG